MERERGEKKSRKKKKKETTRPVRRFIFWHTSTINQRTLLIARRANR